MRPSAIWIARWMREIQAWCTWAWARSSIRCEETRASPGGLRGWVWSLFRHVRSKTERLDAPRALQLQPHHVPARAREAHVERGLRGAALAQVDRMRVD